MNLSKTLSFLLAFMVFWLVVPAQAVGDEVFFSGPGEETSNPPRILSTERTIAPRWVAPRNWMPPNPRSDRDLNYRDRPGFVPQATHDESLWFEPSFATPPSFNKLAHDRSGWPADPMVAAGPSDVITAINFEFAIWDKYGRERARFNINDFLGDNSLIFDPKIIYDVFENRFVMVWILRDDGTSVATRRSFWIVMVSDNSTAEGNWTVYNVDAHRVGSGTDKTIWVDYPYVGVDDDALILSGDNIGYPGSANGGQSRLRFLRKSEIYAGNSSYAFWDLVGLQTNGVFDRRMAVSTHTLPSGPAYVVNSERGGGSNIIVRTYTNTTFVNGTPPTVVKDIDPVTPYSSAPAMAQGGGNPGLESQDCSLINCVTVNNELFFAHGTAANFGLVRGAIKTYRYSRITSAVIDEDIIGSSLYDASYGAVAARPDLSDRILVMSSSALTEFPSARVFGRRNIDPTWGSSTNLVSGNAFVDVTNGTGRNRWGDYAGATLDPSDDETFYVAHMAARPGNDYDVHLARFNRLPTARITGLLATPYRYLMQTEFRATVRDANNNPLSGRTVQFRRQDNQLLGTAVSNAQGIASINVVIPAVPFGPGWYARVLHTSTENGDFRETDEEPQRTLTELTLNNASVAYGANANLTATFTSPGGTPLPGQIVRFFVNGVEIGNGTTNSSGVATRQFSNLQVGPTTPISASVATTPYVESDTASATLTTTPAPTQMIIQSAQGVPGESIRLTAQLVRAPGTTPVVSKILSFSIAGTQVGLALTNAQGVASGNFVVPAGAPSQALSVSATFGGDGLHQAANANAGFTRWARRLQGFVNLEDFSASPEGRTANVTMRLANGAIANQYVATLDATGNYTVYTNFTSNQTFRVQTKSSHWLSSTIVQSVSGALPAPFSHSLKNGDVVEDNEVGPSDFAALASAFGTFRGDSGYVANADLNGDDEVGPADFAILSKNFGEFGD